MVSLEVDQRVLTFWNKRSITVVYIDFSKAFGSVVHNKLLHKLASCGISGCLLRWI